MDYKDEYLLSDTEFIALLNDIDTLSDQQINELIDNCANELNNKNEIQLSISCKKTQPNMSAIEKRRLNDRINYYKNREQNIKWSTDYYYRNREKILANKRKTTDGIYTGKPGRPRKKVPEYVFQNDM